jgi:hypothetical protein
VVEIRTFDAGAGFDAPIATRSNDTNSETTLRVRAAFSG